MSWSIYVGPGFMFAVTGVFITVGGMQLARKLQAEDKAVAEQPAKTVPGGLPPCRLAPAHLKALLALTGQRGLSFCGHTLPPTGVSSSACKQHGW